MQSLGMNTSQFCTLPATARPIRRGPVSRVHKRRLRVCASSSAAGGGGDGRTSGDGLRATASALWSRLGQQALSVWSSLNQQQQQQGGTHAEAAAAAPDPEQPPAVGGSGSVQQDGRSQELTFRFASGSGSSMDAPGASADSTLAAAAAGEGSTAATGPAGEGGTAAAGPAAPPSALLSWDGSDAVPGAGGEPGSGGDGDIGWEPDPGLPHPPKPWPRMVAGGSARW